MQKGPHKSKSLCGVLQRRNLACVLFGVPTKKFECLADQLFEFRVKTSGQIDWQLYDNKKLIEYGKAYCSAKGIIYINQLAVQNSPLLRVLRKRNLVKQVLPDRFLEETIEGRYFKIRYVGRSLNWQSIPVEALNIYAALICRRDGCIFSKLPAGLVDLVDYKTVSRYIDKLPNLDAMKAAELRKLYQVYNNFDLPLEVLAAYGFELIDDPTFSCRSLKKRDK